jgi:hypothetical protein
MPKYKKAILSLEIRDIILKNPELMESKSFRDDNLFKLTASSIRWILMEHPNFSIYFEKQDLDKTNLKILKEKHKNLFFKKNSEKKFETDITFIEALRGRRGY